MPKWSENKKIFTFFSLKSEKNTSFFLLLNKILRNLFDDLIVKN